MNKSSKIFIGIFFSLLVIFSSGAVILYRLAAKSFPVTDGALSLRGLKKPVTIFRDAYGIPHIIAENDHDLFFSQGYVHAQDRLWQMDIFRRAAEGRLSEIFGTPTLQYDKLFRTIAFRRTAEAVERNLSAESRTILEAYAEGINAFINTHKGAYPVEFDILNYEPEEWTPAHSLMISRFIAWQLNFSWYVDLTFQELVNKFGEERGRELFPYGWEKKTAAAKKPAQLKKTASLMKAEIPLNMLLTDLAAKKFLGLSGNHTGSNAWAVSAEKTTGAFPLLANDTHLPYINPSLWYINHLSGGSVNVIGFTLPGTPLVLVGGNNNIGWGITNMMADQSDFFLEKTDSLNSSFYFYKKDRLEFETVSDTIQIKDSSSVPVTLRFSRHGPIINDVYLPAESFIGRPIALRWTGQDSTDDFLSLYKMNIADDWQQFREGVRLFNAPGQNFIYIDRKGNIGYQAGVKLPLRPLQQPTLLLPGWTGENEWNGFVPFEELPSIFNPPEKFIASANNKFSDEFPYYVSNHWEPSARIDRIREYLLSQPKFSAEDFRHFQTDYFNVFAREMTPYIIHAYDSVSVTDRDIETVLTYFRNWNFNCTDSDVPSTIFHVWFQNLMRNMFERTLGDTLYAQYVQIPNIPLTVIPVLMKDPSSVWFDNPATACIESRDTTIRKSMDDALAELRILLGNEMKQWRWGTIHTVTFRHILGEEKMFAGIFSIGPFAIGGSGTTVNNQQFMFNDPYRAVIGPAMRMIINFGKSEPFSVVIPTGQSGQPLHHHFTDQTGLWRNGGLIPLSLFREQYEAAATEQLKIIPQ